MNNMYAMVLFVVVIMSTSSILSVSSNNDGYQEIFMVVDDPTSVHHAGMGMSKATLWCTNSRETKATLDGHSQAITDVIFSPSMLKLATSSQDTIRIWDLENVKPVEIGKFLLEDEKVLTLARKSSPSRNCIDLGQPCGTFHWCCDPYICSVAGWPFNGRCEILGI